MSIKNISNINLVTVSNTTHLDEDMASVGDWTDGSNGNGSYSQVTFDSKSCMKLEATASGGQGLAYRDTGTFSTRTTYSVNLYCDAVGTMADFDVIDIKVQQGTNYLAVAMASDGFFVRDASTYNEVGTNLVVQDTWQEWTFDINWSTATVDVYLDGVLQASGVDCASVGGTNGRTDLRAISSTANVLSVGYVDWVKVGDNLLSASSKISSVEIANVGKILNISK